MLGRPIIIIFIQVTHILNLFLDSQWSSYILFIFWKLLFQFKFRSYEYRAKYIYHRPPFKFFFKDMSDVITIFYD